MTIRGFEGSIGSTVRFAGSLVLRFGGSAPHEPPEPWNQNLSNPRTLRTLERRDAPPSFCPIRRVRGDHGVAVLWRKHGRIRGV